KIKVEWCGICGSDLHEYVAGPIFIPVDAPHPLTGAKAPIILGHEFSGVITEVGEGVTGWKAGDRVAPDACQHCGECYLCKRNRYNICDVLAFTGLMADGAFAEYVNVPANILYKVPDNVSMEAAALIEPMAVGVHAVKLSQLEPGDTVVIFGAGTIGLVTLQAALAGGAGKVYVIEIAEARKKMAAENGATLVIDPTKEDPVAKVKELTGGLGADVAFECIGNHKTAVQAVDIVRKAGTIMMVGIFEQPSEIYFQNMTFTEKKIIGSLAYNGEFEAAINFLSDGRMKAEPLITGKIKLDDLIEKGFEELVNNKDKNIKIIVTPN
ncbi:MAG: 2,3-butanediol dehydrogenase, partial [Bacillota bacterium]